MADHGGKRKGAGRPRGAKSRATRDREQAAASVASAMDFTQLPADPLSIALRAARTLEQLGDFAKAGALAARLCRFTVQPLRPTERAPAAHPEQPLLPFDDEATGSRAVPADSPAAAAARRLLQSLN